MADRSSIEWTDATWNPTVGCSRVAEGCRHCYAELMAWRHVKMCQALGRRCKYEGTVEMGANGPHWTGLVRLDADSLTAPLHWRAPRRVFVDSMSDLFHEGLSFEDIAAVFGIMAACPQHTFQVLTKRSARAVEFLKWLAELFGPSPAAPLYGLTYTLTTLEINYPRTLQLQTTWPLPNVWIGTSVAEQKDAEANIPHLLQIPAAVRFLSVEPLIESVDLRNVTAAKPRREPWQAVPVLGEVASIDCLRGEMVQGRLGFGCSRIDWVIVGGESGPGARPCHVGWVRSVIAQCKAASVPVFVKQLGASPVAVCPVCHGTGTNASFISGQEFGTTTFCSRCMGGHRQSLLLRDRKGGDWNEWPEDLRIRQFPAEVVSA